MNYLSKKNFGIPAGILSAIAVLLGYSMYNSLSLVWVTLVFTAVVFLFNFDENVKSTLKQSLLLAFYGWLVSFVFVILRSVLGWFSGAQGSDSEAIRTTYKVFGKILEVVEDGVDFIFIFLFFSLLFSAIKGKVTRIGFLTSSVEAADKETVACPKCGTPVDKGSAFCTKCGNKMN